MLWWLVDDLGDYGAGYGGCGVVDTRTVAWPP